MSGGGGKGGSQTTKQELPAWLNSAARRSVSRGESAARVGYMPWQGPDVAAQTPMQQAAMQGANQAAAAFGLPQAQNAMPPPTTFAGGVQGYSSFPMYEAARSAWAQANPGQAAAFQRLFANPQGSAPRAPAPAPRAPAPIARRTVRRDDDDDDDRRSRSGSSFRRGV